MTGLMNPDPGKMKTADCRDLGSQSDYCVPE